jgi:hypothetical protein
MNGTSQSLPIKGKIIRTGLTCSDLVQYNNYYQPNNYINGYNHELNLMNQSNSIKHINKHVSLG